MKKQNKIYIFGINEIEYFYNVAGSKSIAFKDKSLRNNTDEVKVKISEDFS